MPELSVALKNNVARDLYDDLDSSGISSEHPRGSNLTKDATNGFVVKY